KRYQFVVEKYPEFTHANLARYGLAMALYRKGDLEKARAALEAVPGPDRVGDLAIVPYQLADVLLRLAPKGAADAVAARKLEEALKTSIELLDGFVGGTPQSPQAPDALLKLGHCHQRMAALAAQPPEAQKSLAAARAVYERINQQYPRSEARPFAIFERAK